LTSADINDKLKVNFQDIGESYEDNNADLESRL